MKKNKIILFLIMFSVLIGISVYIILKHSNKNVDVNIYNDKVEQEYLSESKTETLPYEDIKDDVNVAEIVNKDKKWGIKFKDDDEAISYEYDYIKNFSEGFFALNKDGKWGFISKDGKESIPLIYDNIGVLSEGLANVKRDGKFGYVDENGKEVIECSYYTAEPFEKGSAVISIKKDKGYGLLFGYINFTGKEIVPCQYDELIRLKNGYSIAGKNYKYYILDEMGEIIREYDYIREFSEGMAAVRNEDGKYGYIDDSGNELILCNYDEADIFSEGLARIELDGKCGYIDKNGNVVFWYELNYFYDGSNFKEGMARISNGGKYGYIDKTGKEVIPCIYEYAEDFSGGFASVNKNGKWIYINKNGDEFLGDEVYIQSSNTTLSEEEKSKLNEVSNLVCKAYESEEYGNLINGMKVDMDIGYDDFISFYSSARKIGGNYVEYYSGESYNVADIDNDGIDDVLIDYGYGSVGRNSTIFLKGLNNGDFEVTNFYDVWGGGLNPTIIEYKGTRFEYRTMRYWGEDEYRGYLYLWKDGKQVAGKCIFMDTDNYKIEVEECKDEKYNVFTDKYLTMLTGSDSDFYSMIGTAEKNLDTTGNIYYGECDINNDGTLEKYSKYDWLTSVQHIKDHIRYEVNGDIYYFNSFGLDLQPTDSIQGFWIEEDYLGENIVCFLYSIGVDRKIEGYKFKENSYEKVFSLNKIANYKYVVEETSPLVVFNDCGA